MLRSTETARLIATATALVVAGSVVSSDANPAPAPAETTTPGTAAAPAGLDGTYRAELSGSRGRFAGAPYQSQDSTRWYAIRSRCEASECTARAVSIDDPDGSSTPPPRRAFDLTFQQGDWVGGPIADSAPCLADPTREVALVVEWHLEAHPDGTLTGTRTLTEPKRGTAPCAGSGGGYEVPVVLIPTAGTPR